MYSRRRRRQAMPLLWVAAALAALLGLLAAESGAAAIATGAAPARAQARAVTTERGGRARRRRQAVVAAVQGFSLPVPRRESLMEGLKNGAASGLATACVKAMLQPFDSIKTVQQFSTLPMTLVEAAHVLLARGGPVALYSGLGVTLIGSMPANCVYFGIYQMCRRQLAVMEANGGPRLGRNGGIAIGAAIGNFVATFFRVPPEIVKQRLQAGVYPSTAVAIATIYRQGGLLGFFGKGGLATQWARDIPYAVVTLLVYESLQGWARRRRNVEGGAALSVLETMAIGAIAGGIGTLATSPMDVVKTRMMTAPDRYTGAMDAAWSTLHKEGPLALFKGATPRLLHKIPANGAFFVAYEFFRSLLGVTDVGAAQKR